MPIPPDLAVQLDALDELVRGGGERDEATLNLARSIIRGLTSDSRVIPVAKGTLFSVGARFGTLYSDAAHAWPNGAESIRELIRQELAVVRRRIEETFHV